MNPKFILGSASAILALGAVAGLSYQAGKSAGMDVGARSGAESGTSGKPSVIDQDPKPAKSEDIISDNGKDLEEKASVNKSHKANPQEELDVKLLEEEKLKLEEQVQKIEKERKELEQLASAERIQFEEVKKEKSKLEEQVQQLESGRNQGQHGKGENVRSIRIRGYFC